MWVECMPGLVKMIESRWELPEIEIASNLKVGNDEKSKELLSGDTAKSSDYKHHFFETIDFVVIYCRSTQEQVNRFFSVLP